MRVSNVGYYARPELSNSQMGVMAAKLGGGSGNIYNAEAAFALGSAVDSLLTGSRYPESEHDAELAMAMSDAWLLDPANRLLFNDFDKQVAFVSRLELWLDDGTEFYVDGRCLCDFYSNGLIADLKTTSANTKDDWYKSVITYAYYRQAAWYMDIVGVDVFSLRAVSKHYPYELFNTTIVRGDDFYKRGHEDYLEVCRAGFLASMCVEPYASLL